MSKKNLGAFIDKMIEIGLQDGGVEQSVRINVPTEILTNVSRVECGCPVPDIWAAGLDMYGSGELADGYRSADFADEVLAMVDIDNHLAKLTIGERISMFWGDLYGVDSAAERWIDYAGNDEDYFDMLDRIEEYFRSIEYIREVEDVSLT